MRRFLLAVIVFALLLLGFYLWVQAQTTDCVANEAWRCGAALPTARSEIQAAVLDGTIYVAGGLGLAGKVHAEFESYDISSNSWQTLAPLPRALHHAALAAADGRIFLSGGYDDLQMARGSRWFYAYDPDTNTWLQEGDMPGPRAAHVMLNIAEQLYIIGGIGDDLYALWRYDPKTKNWETDLSPLPTAREHLAAAVINDEIYVIGGRLQGNLASLEIYQPSSDAWREAPPMPTPRGGLTAAAVKGQLHVTGGEAFSPAQTFAEHEVFDPTTKTWSSLEPMPTGRHGLASVAFEDGWYVIGGATKAGAQTIISLSSAVAIYSSE